MELKTKNSKIYSQTNIGAFEALLEKNSGEKAKQFLRDSLHLTGMEISINAFPPNTTAPFFHSHKQNEELYVVLKGEGQMQLDDEVLDLAEGTVIRVAPSAARCIKSGAKSELIYLCIQAKEGSLEQCTKEDGALETRKELWT